MGDTGDGYPSYSPRSTESGRPTPMADDVVPPPQASPPQGTPSTAAVHPRLRDHTHQACATPDAELPVEPLRVRANGVWRQVQSGRDLLLDLATQHAPHQRKLTR